MTPQPQQPDRTLKWEPHWITPPELYKKLDGEFHFNYDPCPFPKPKDYNGIEANWGTSNYVNPPFHPENGIGPTAFVRKAIEENKKGKTVVLTIPTQSYVNLLLEAGAELRSLGRVKWLHTVTREPMKGPSPITAFILRTRPTPAAPTSESEAEDSFRIYRSEWQSLESMLDECGCDDGKRILYQILTEERDLEHLDAAVATKARECLMKDAKCKKLYFTCRVPDLETLKEGIDRLSQPWSIDVLREIEIIRREHDTAIATQSREEVLKTILLQILEEIRNGCILSTKSGGEYYNVSKEWIDDKIESLRTGGGK